MEEYSRQAVEEAAQFIKAKCLELPVPSVGMICGSGLNEIGARIENKVVIPYSNIPHFPDATVHGHKKQLICGELGGKIVLCMLGRLHLYEGYPAWKIGFPVRVMKLLGIQVLLLTNAAGSLNLSYSVGDLVVIRDHICLPALEGNSPLTGPNDDSFGPRFLDMSGAYDKNLRLLMNECVTEMDLQDKVKEGIYCMISGPSFASAAEMKTLRFYGADVVGMSTAPETIVARHCGVRVLAMSLVTDEGIFEVDNGLTVSHAAVLAVARQNAQVMETLFINFLRKLRLF